VEIVTVELFDPNYWKWYPEKTIRLSKEKTEKVVEKYFK
jgi:2-keto-myo-inositol isomerase